MAESTCNENPLPPLGDGGKASDDLAVVESPVKRTKLSDAEQDSAASASSGGCDVEVVKRDEFEFLDGVTRLATLEAELDDVKAGLMSRGGLDRYVPFRLFRPWGQRVLSVTDLSDGNWCEVKVEYRKLHPHLKNTREWKKRADKGRPVVLRTEVMKKGSEVHLKKELEVHEIVQVKMVTKEDRVAVQLINTFTQLSAVKSEVIEREIHVFGDPFERGVMVRGVIDQLQYCRENNELILTDNKTRWTKSLPKPGQKKATSLQLMLYKYLLDRMCLGLTTAGLLYHHLKLDRESFLTQEPLDHIRRCGLGGLFSEELGSQQEGGAGGLKFGTVAECILLHIAGLGLPLVGSLMVNYEHQGSGETLGVDAVEYDEKWVEAELERSLEFWEGSRPAQGVDIEAAWKCGSCQFRDVCTWRLERQLEASPAAKLPLSP